MGLTAATAFGAFHTPARAAYNNGAIFWRENALAFNDARVAAKPIFMLVHAEWCPACKVYSKLFYDQQVVRKLEAFVPVLINADKSDLAKKYNPDGDYIPRSMILSSDGEIYQDVTGPYDHKFFLPPKEVPFLLDFLDRGLARAGVIPRDQVVMSSPSRKAAPTGDIGPSLARAQPAAGTASAPANGPKRVTVPKRATAPAPNPPTPAAEAAPAPAPAGEETTPGIVGRLLKLLD